MMCICPRASETPGGAGLCPQALNRTRGTPYTRPKFGRRRIHFDGPPSLSFLFIELLKLVDRSEGILFKRIAHLVDPAHLDRVEQHATNHFWSRRRGLPVHRSGGPLTRKISDKRGSGRGSDDSI